jgi:hypothetical protein
MSDADGGERKVAAAHAKTSNKKMRQNAATQLPEVQTVRNFVGQRERVGAGSSP